MFGCRLLTLVAAIAFAGCQPAEQRCESDKDCPEGVGCHRPGQSFVGVCQGSPTPPPADAAAAPPPAPPGPDPAPAADGPTSPDVVYDPPPAVAPWIVACVGWIRAHCQKAATCMIPASECDKDERWLQQDCRMSAAQDGCQQPDPAGFEQCRMDTEAKTCDQFCPPGQRFCFNWCHYPCLDPR